jgi:hypothetical protein
MAKLSILAGATSQSVTVFIQNSSVSTGAGLTGLVYNTTNLIAYYAFTGANGGSNVISLATLAAANSAYSSGGFKEIDSTNMPGMYRLDIPNAAIAGSKGRSSVIMLSGATNMAPCVLEIELTGWDNQVAYSSTTVGTVTTVTNQLTAAAIATGVWQDATGSDFTTSSSIGKSLYTSGVAPGGTNGLFIAGTNAATAITTGLTAHIIGTVDTLTTYTGNTPQTGDNYARLGAPAGASVSADIAAINAKTTNLPAAPASTSNITSGTITTVTNLTNAPTAGDFTATMKTSIGTAVAASAVASVTAAVAITSNRKKGSGATFEFLMQDATTGAPKTGLTVASTISKDGGAPGATSNSVSEIGLGQYQIVLTGTEMTANNVFLQMTSAGAITTNLSIQTQP